MCIHLKDGRESNNRSMQQMWYQLILMQTEWTSWGGGGLWGGLQMCSLKQINQMCWYERSLRSADLPEAARANAMLNKTTGNQYFL